MNKKMKPAQDNTQKEQRYKAFITELEHHKQYLRDTMQKEHSAAWWEIVYAFVSHYKDK